MNNIKENGEKYKKRLGLNPNLINYISSVISSDGNSFTATIEYGASPFDGLDIIVYSGAKKVPFSNLILTGFPVQLGKLTFI